MTAEAPSPPRIAALLFLLLGGRCAVASTATCGASSPGVVIGTGGTKYTVEAESSCCSRCLADPECLSYTFDGPPSNTCYVKDNAVGTAPCKSDHPNCTSSLRGSGPAPSPSSPTPAPGPAGVPNGQGCLTAAARALPYCNTSLSLDARVQDLAARLSVEELAARLTSNSLTPAVDAVGLPAFNYRVEAIHGLEAYCIALDATGDGERQRIICPTYFPSSQGMAASFNRSVFANFGAVVGREARIWANLHGNGKSERAMGLNVRCPMVNLLRDARWGRSGESASECPLLTSAFGAAVVDAIQRRDPASGAMLAISEVKHGFVYNLETSRKSFDAQVSKFDLMDTYLPPWAATLPRARAYMCSYNAVNSVPACMNSFLAQTTARAHWNFSGFIESDCDSVGDIEVDFKLANDSAAASALAINAGCDIDCGGTFAGKEPHAASARRAAAVSSRRRSSTPGGLAGAVARNLTSLATLRTAFARAMRPIFETGQFDGINATSFATLGAADAASHAALARDAAAQSLVLLKNTNGTLPLPARISSVALLGPLALARAELVGPVTIGPCPGSHVSAAASGTGGGAWGGGYKGTYDCVPNLNESLHAIAADVLAPGATISVAPGAPSLTSTDTKDIAGAVVAARAADATILAVGSGLSVVDEGADLSSIALPGVQPQLVRAVAAALRGTGKPLVVLLIGANALALDSWIEDVPALINCFIPSGTWGAATMLAAAFGRAGNRFGKLPYTHYVEDYAAAVPVTSMSFAAPMPNPHGVPGRSYRFLRNASRWSTHGFGFGLSYTSFTLAPAAAGDARGVGGLSCAGAADQLAIAVDVGNSGAVDGDEVVQLYASPPAELAANDSAVLGGAPVPIKNLVDFSRVRVRAGASATVRFSLACADLTFVDARGRKVLWPYNLSLEVSNGNGQRFVLPVGMAFEHAVVLDAIQPGADEAMAFPVG